MKSLRVKDRSTRGKQISYSSNCNRSQNLMIRSHVFVWIFHEILVAFVILFLLLSFFLPFASLRKRIEVSMKIVIFIFDGEQRLALLRYLLILNFITFF